jgi:putative addiction module component (TIGR02574 family)
MSKEQVEKEALALSLKERAALAETLLQSLDGGYETATETAWITEAERRFAELKTGQVKGIPASVVLEEIRQLLR